MLPTVARRNGHSPAKLLLQSLPKPRRSLNEVEGGGTAMVPADATIPTLIKVLMTVILRYSISDPGGNSVRSASASRQLFLPERHPGSVQDPSGDLLDGGEVSQTVSAVAASCPVVKDCWWVSPFSSSDIS